MLGNERGQQSAWFLEQSGNASWAVSMGNSKHRHQQAWAVSHVGIQQGGLGSVGSKKRRQILAWISSSVGSAALAGFIVVGMEQHRWRAFRAAWASSNVGSQSVAWATNILCGEQRWQHAMLVVRENEVVAVAAFAASGQWFLQL